MNADKLAFLRNHATTFGDFFSFRLGPTRVVVINDLDAIYRILIEDAPRFPKSSLTKDIFGRIMGNGLMVNEGESHRRQRRLVQPAFDAKRLRSYAGVAIRHANAVADRWSPGAEIDVEAEMSRVTLSVAAEVSFGADIGPGIERLTTAMRDLQAAGAALFNAGFVPPAWLPTPKNRALRRAVAEFDAVLDQIIAARREDPVDRGDLLSMLLLSGAEGEAIMSLQEVRDEVRTIFLSGFETTANALTWTWYYLAREERARIELERDLLRDVPSGSSDFGIAPYATMCIKEALRMSSPTWAFNRTPAERLEIGGYELVPGDLILISPYLLHRDPRHFPHPERFEPERFSEGRESQIPRLAFLPFGAGPRICIGARLAMLEIGMIVSTILKRFRLTLPEGYVAEPEAFITIRPKDGLRMTVSPSPIC